MAVVIFSPEADADLEAILTFAAGDVPRAAFRFAERVRAYCESLSLFPHRGTLRSDFEPGLRTVGFNRRVVIAFHVDGEDVTIDRIFYRGRNVAAALRGADPGD